MNLVHTIGTVMLILESMRQSAEVITLTCYIGDAQR